MEALVDHACGGVGGVLASLTTLVNERVMRYPLPNNTSMDRTKGDLSGYTNFPFFGYILQFFEYFFLKSQNFIFFFEKPTGKSYST